MNRFAAHLQSMPLPARFAAVGAICAGAAGAIAGLVIGLDAYVQTAWFAVFELGLPAAVVGAVAGLFVGALTLMMTRDKSGR